MSFVIFDTEYIADKGLLEEGFDGWKNLEIIQIAALKIDEKLEVIDSLNLYIKPIKHQHISAYFSDLTGITDEIILQKGISFPEAYQRFRTFVQDDVCYSHGWGSDDDADGVVMRQTMSYYDLNDINPPKYKNIAPWFEQQYKLHHLDIKKQSSGQVASLLGMGDELIRLNLQPHNAFYDVYSLLIGLRYFDFCGE